MMIFDATSGVIMRDVRKSAFGKRSSPKNVGIAAVAALVALVFAMVLAIPASAQASASQANGALSIANLQITPQPVVAGDNITVEFQLFNSYSEQLQNVNIYLESQSPLINVSPTQTFLVSAMGTGLYGGSGYDIFSYKFHVPASLPAGEYVIDVIATYESQAGVQYPTLPAESVMPIDIYVYGVPSIQLSATTQGQITPGMPLQLDLSALNSGTDKASNVSITLLNASGFSIEGAYSFELGSIEQGLQQEASMQLIPASNITSGMHTLSFMVNYTSQTGEKYSNIEKVPLYITVNRPSFIASIVNAMPQQLYPGQNQTLEIEIENTGDGAAKNVSVQFIGTDNISVGGAAEFNLGNVAAGQAMQESVFISAGRDANSTHYNLPVEIKYYNANMGMNYTQIEYLPINLAPSAIFNITSEHGILRPGSTDVPVTFTIKNIGNEVAQSAMLSLQAIYPISTVIPNAYVSSISPGQSENVTFYVSVDTKGDIGSYPVTVYEQWQQPNGAAQQQYSYSNNYYVTVSNGSSGSGLYTDAAVAVVIVLIIAYFAVRMGKGRKVRKEKEPSRRSERQ